MQVRGTPGVVVIAPRISARLDGLEAVPPRIVGERPPGAGEIGVERRVVLIYRVPVAPARVRLPELDQRIGYGTRILVEHAPAHDHALADRLARVLPCQIVFVRPDL